MILIGTSGYSYADWRGPFYPAGLPQRDFLAWYTGCFPAVELNSSYYALPSPALVQSLALRTPDNFQIVVKAHRSITHERSDEPSAGLQKFLAALTPLQDSGKLAAILLQFPSSFRYGQAQLGLVETLLEGIGQIPPVVEFRHSSWMTDKVWETLRVHDAALCCVDEPPLPGLIPARAVCTSSRLGYVRFHGRNAEKWWKHEEAWERYDYLYREEELREWLEGLAWLAERTEKTFIFFNNHREGQAVRNAREMARLLEVPLPGGPSSQLEML